MSRQDGVSQWIATVSTQMPHLSRPQARVLALWSYGMVVTQSCGLTTVATFLALLLGKRPSTMRQQLREWCYAAADKKGRQRQEVAVPPCFVLLVRWILTWWPAEERRLVLALDATTLGQRFTVLALSVVYRGCAIPVAWVVVPATQKGAWRPHWEGLFTRLHGSVPADWTVLVLADRPTAASMRAGCTGTSSAWAGIPSCASTRGGSSALTRNGASVRSARPRPASARAGAGRWTASPRASAGSPVPCWRAGKRHTPSPGSS